MTGLPGDWQVHRAVLVQEISDKIRQVSPHFLCFEFDFPDLEGLRAVKTTKLRFPELPILMLTDYHSEDLAVWAFRARVWDFLVKPLSSSDLHDRVETLFNICLKRD